MRIAWTDGTLLSVPIWVDFNSASRRGIRILDETIEQLQERGTVVQSGMKVLLCDEDIPGDDLLAVGLLQLDSTDGTWWAVPLEYGRESGLIGAEKDAYAEARRARRIRA
jgi:hypothetical protein